MSSYTMQLREYIEMFSQEQGVTNKDIIENGRKKLFDFDYPIFDEAYRKVFETHFIRKFYMREIGFETEGLFKFQLETWLIINMPYFNKMFESELIQFNPLENSKTDSTHNTKKDKTSTANAKSDGTATGTGNETRNSFDRNLDSDTPDSRLTITTQDGSGVIEYASSIQENKANSSANSNNTSTSTSNTDATGNINEVEDYIQHKAGKIGVQTYSKMLTEYRESFARIENMMFKEMQQLFMLVY